MSAYTFGQLPEDAPDQPGLFADLDPAPTRKRASARDEYRGGQAALCCARCFEINGPFIRSRDGYAYCVPCARLASKEK